MIRALLVVVLAVTGCSEKPAPETKLQETYPSPSPSFEDIVREASKEVFGDGYDEMYLNDLINVVDKYQWEYMRPKGMPVPNQQGVIAILKKYHIVRDEINGHPIEKHGMIYISRKKLRRLDARIDREIEEMKSKKEGGQ